MGAAEPRSFADLLRSQPFRFWSISGDAHGAPLLFSRHRKAKRSARNGPIERLLLCLRRAALTVPEHLEPERAATRRSSSVWSRAPSESRPIGGSPLRKSRYSDEQITAALRQAEAGTPVAEIIRKLGISEATVYA